MSGLQSQAVRREKPDGMESWPQTGIALKSTSAPAEIVADAGNFFFSAKQVSFHVLCRQIPISDPISTRTELCL
jgi:hypothetical protein